MADIEKGLPNTKIPLPGGAEEVDVNATIFLSDLANSDDPTVGNISLKTTKYADYETSIVNPIAMIETSCMMLDFIDEQNIANKIRKAVSEVIQKGNVQTYDMAKMSGQSDVVEKGAASTVQMAQAIIDKL